MFIPPHPTPTAPSSYAIVRWWFSQDHELHRLECSIAGFSVQLEENRRRLKVLNQENESLKLELDQALGRKRKVRHEPTLPNYKQMYQNFEVALEAMRTLRHDLPLHQFQNECRREHELARSYPDWLVPPPKPPRWYAAPQAQILHIRARARRLTQDSPAGGSGACRPRASLPPGRHAHQLSAT